VSRTRSKPGTRSEKATARGNCSIRGREGEEKEERKRIKWDKENVRNEDVCRE
jgi:hypothetical protein